MKKITLSLVLVLFHVLLFGQKALVFEGTVKDAASGVGLPNASLIFDNGRFSGKADTTGYFRINITSGEHTLVVRYVSYKPFRTKLDLTTNQRLDILLKDNNTELDDVVIKGTTQSNARNITIGVNVIDIKGIKKLPAILGEVDVLRSLQTLPGVSSVGEGANGVNIRGGNVDQNLIYVDDAPIFNPTHMFGLFSVFPADAIRGLELYKGGVPARYGGRVSSVLDIKMLEPSLDRFKMQAGIGPVSNRLTLEIPLIKEKLSIMSSGRLSYNDFWLKLFGGPSISGTKANFLDLAHKISFKPNAKTKIDFSHYFSTDNYGVDSLFAIENVLARNTNFKYGHNNSTLKISRVINSKLSLNLVGVSSVYATNTFSNDSATSFALKSRLAYKNLRLNADYALNKKHQLNFGINAIRHDILPGDFNKDISSIFRTILIPKEQSYELAAYVSDEIKISDKIGIDIGLRYVQFLNIGPYTVNEYLPNQPTTLTNVVRQIPIGNNAIESKYNGFEPRFVLKYAIGKNDALKIGYNRMQQFVQLVSNNITPLPTARWKTSDRFTPPARSDFATIGYFKNMDDNTYELSGEIYFRKTKNFMSYTTGANLQLNPNLETQLLFGDSRAYGMELMVAKTKGETTGWISYTYARALQQILGNFPESQQLNDGKWFPTDFDKPNTVTSTVTSRINKHHAFTWNFLYSTGRPFTVPIGVYQIDKRELPIYTDRNNDRISDYHRLDFSWTITNPKMRTKSGEGSWVFTVYNIYGRKNAYSYYFKARPYGLELNKLSVFATPFLSLIYNYTIR